MASLFTLIVTYVMQLLVLREPTFICGINPMYKTTWLTKRPYWLLNIKVMNHTCTYNHRYYVWCAYYVVTITYVTMQCAIPSVSHVFPTSTAWYPGVGLAEAYLRKVPVAQRKSYLYHQERVLDHPPPLAALNSSEVCSDSRLPFVAEEELGSSLGVPTSR